MKNILIPFDYKIQDEYALDFAAKLAKQSNAFLHLLTFEESVYDDQVYATDKNTTVLTAEHVINKRGAFLEKISFLDAAYVKTISLPVFDITEINRLVSKLKIDLLVAGQHNKSSFNELIFGNTTEKLMRNISCPMITIKEKFKKEKIANIVFASDFEEEIKLPFFNLLQLATSLNAKTHLLYVNTPDDFKNTAYIRQLMESFSEDYKKDTFTVNTYDAHLVDEGILDFCHEMNADLIGIITHEKTRFSLMSSSMTEKISNKSDVPVLAISII